MNDIPSSHSDPKDRRRPRRRAAGLSLLLALGGIALAGYLAWRQFGQMSAEIAVPTVAGAIATAAVAAFLVEFRTMSASEILEAVWEAVLLLFAAIGAALGAIWRGFLGLIGLD